MVGSSVRDILAQAAKDKRTSLNLSGKGINTLPESIGNLTNLTSLNLSSNNLIKLPDSIGNLTNLTSLNLRSNNLIKLPDSIGNLTNLISLNLRSNDLKNLPESIGNLTDLTSLNLSFNKLTKLPESIGNLTNLTSLNLRYTGLKTLPESFGNLINFTSLDLRYTGLTKLPESIGNLTNLTSLNLSSNKLTKLPESIGNLTNLTSLNLSSNKLTKLPESIGNLIKLTSLDLRYTGLKTLPESFGNLINFSSLDLRYTGLTKLPESIGNLIKLTSLVLSFNKLTKLPESIGNLIKLTSLDVTSNQLQKLPESIGNLQSLEELKVTKNKLVSLPQSLVSLNQLSMLTISSNKLDLPPEITRKRKPEKILDFLRQQQEEGIDYIYEAKLLVVGEGSAGKTSLANKLINPKYELKLEGDRNPEKSTEGIDVLRLDFSHTSGNSFRINLWDFGGQEIYHATHQFFLTKRSLYLLVADTRQDNTDFNYWLEVIELLSEASPTLIVKNEKQDRPCQINEKQLYGRFTNQLKEVLATNLATNRGLSEVLTAIQHHISQLPHIGNSLPKTWVRVRESLETDQRNYIPQSEFLRLCDTHGFKRRADKLQLSAYLHDLGVCLHFQDDPVLKNWIILKPEWGTTAVYAVLDTPSVQQSLGCFTHQDLTKIWADEQYTDMRDELLQLMMRFKLCYEIPHRPRTYIAPQLLSPNQPDYIWNNTDNLILRYEYEFMPKGMLTRFSVEMHKLIDSELIWKEGIVLTDGNARAEVIESYYKKEIRIRISGKLKKPLRERIRYELEKIHASYNDPDDPPENHRLRYQEFIPCNCSQCKGSQTPYSYPLKRLEERLKNKRQQIECDKSYEMVGVRNLIDDAIGDGNLNQQPTNARSIEEPLNNQTFIINAGNPKTTHQPMSNTINQYGQGDNYGGDNVHGDKIHTQINNNPDLAELLTILTTLRQTATQFPEDIQEDITINIEDLETEVQKPAEQRSKARLKRSLIALAGVATLIAAPVAGMADFTNNVLELGEKLQIELPASSD